MTRYKLAIESDWSNRFKVEASGDNPAVAWAHRTSPPHSPGDEGMVSKSKWDTDGDGVKDTFVITTAAYQAHVADDGSWGGNAATGTSYIELYVKLDVPAPTSGSITYTTAGSAVDGVNYTIDTAYASPVAFVSGDEEVPIRINILDPEKWHAERMLKLTLTGGSNCYASAAPHAPSEWTEGSLEFRVYIRATDDPPVLSWTAASSSGAEGAHDISGTLDTASADDVAPYFTVNASSTAVEGTDYTLSAAGGKTIAAGGTSGAAATVTVLPGATASRTVVLDLDHERKAVNAGVEEEGPDANYWVTTGDWTQEATQPRFPGTPSVHVSGGFEGNPAFDLPDNWKGDVDAYLEHTGQALQVVDTDQTNALGDSIYGVVQGNWNLTNSYIRESFAAGYLSGGVRGRILEPLAKYARVSVSLASWPAAQSYREWRFFRLTLRTRTRDINHAVMFQRGQAAGDVSRDADGNSVATVGPFDGWYYSLWKADSLRPGSAWGTEFGVGTRSINGVDVPTAWVSHDASDLMTGTATAGTEDETLVDASADFSTVTTGDFAVSSVTGYEFRVLEVLNDTSLRLSAAKATEDPIATGEGYSIKIGYKSGSFGQAPETIGVDSANGLIRFTYWSDSDSSGSLTGGADAHAGRGIPGYWPMLERSESAAYTGVPTKWWPRPNFDWEPRGGAVRNSGTQQHTFTIT